MLPGAACCASEGCRRGRHLCRELPPAVGQAGLGPSLALTSLVCQLLEAAQMQAARGRQPCPRQSAPAGAGEELGPRPPLPLAQQKWSHLCGQRSPRCCPMGRGCMGPALLPGQPLVQHTRMGPALPQCSPPAHPSPPGQSHKQLAGLGRKSAAWIVPHARGRHYQHDCHAAAQCWPPVCARGGGAPSPAWVWQISGGGRPKTHPTSTHCGA